MEKQLIISLDKNIPPTEASKLSRELQETLLSATSDISVNLKRDDPTNMDFGATLVLLLGTPAVVALAKALGDWLRLRKTTNITITNEDGTVVAENLSHKDLELLLERLETVFDK